MYCSKCGNRVSDGLRFCTNCGTPVKKTSLSTPEEKAPTNGYSGYYNRGDQRQEEIYEVKKMLNYFSKKTNEYVEYDKVCKNYAQLKNGRSDMLLIMGIILVIFGFFGPAFMLGGCIGTLNSEQDTVTSMSDVFNFSGIFLGGIATILLVIGICSIVVYIKNKKRDAKNLAYYEKRYFELSDELYKYYFGYKNCPIGPEYTNPANIQVILDTIISGRADSTKEAINILVEDAHRRNMEDMAALTAQYTQQAAAQAGRAATASTVGAVFSAANYFRGR